MPIYTKTKFLMYKIADVLLPIPIDKPFSYKVEEVDNISIGQLVSVPFRTRTLTGVVINISEQHSIDPKIKPINSPFPLTIKKEMITFIEKVSYYTITPKGLILKMCISGAKLNHISDLKTPHTSEELGITLNKAQQEASTFLESHLGHHKTILLEGVTGSGKTEVYNHLIHRIINEGNQCLLLMPEILLATHITSRLKERFGFEAIEWHSNLSPKKRRDNYHMVITGQAKLIIAARSGLFLPFPNLRAIILDEEHDTSYKQEEGVVYNARDIAVLRGQIEKCPVVLCSATPSIETIHNVRIEKYSRIYLPSRFGIAKMPEIKIIDMNKEDMCKDSFISPSMIDAVKHTIESGNQVLLYLNRRGYAPLTICKACGHKVECPNCTAFLVEHKHKKILQCHYCGYSSDNIRKCNNCGSEDKITTYGPGVEKIEEEIKKAIPNIRTSLFTSDHVGSKKDAESMIEAISKREVDAIIGTQMIAKGLHFPKLQFVGVIDADAGMLGGDIRGIERTYQILQQVSGRAGRSEEGGLVMLQTYEPESIMIKHMLSGDNEKFIKEELNDREVSWSPPFSRLIIVHLSAANEIQLIEASHMLARTAPYGEKQITVIGPAPSPIYLIRKKYRYRFIIKSGKNINIQPIIKQWLNSSPLPPTVSVKIDVDPYSFL